MVILSDTVVLFSYKSNQGFTETNVYEIEKYSTPEKLISTP